MHIRSATEEDREVFSHTLHAAFGRYPESPADGDGYWWSALQMERSLIAYTADGRPVGTSGTHAFELTLPGEAIVPAAGVTAVGVVPTHRRQGVLTALTRHQFAQLRSQGQFLAVLLASEAPIYGRFGFGPATYTTKLTLQRHRSALAGRRAPGASAPQAGSLEVRLKDDCADLVEGLYDQYRRKQPGALSRPRLWWEKRAGQAPMSPDPRYIALHRNADGALDGYACYNANGSETLTVDEIVALNDSAFTALAQYACNHDLTTTTVLEHVAPGSPLRWQLKDFRGGEVGYDTDWLWVRILDVPRALTARGWFADGELVLDVVDPFLDEQNRYLLSVQDGKAQCRPTDREPDLSLDIRDLGSLYLGGTSPTTLIRAGHIHTHNADGAGRAEALFRTDRLPHCLHWF
ncbi:GNAT family N-acetyltransferase [Kineosporia babensis]|uniref:GNAT family N-acetyltransferase n=1 Tax=Kineosporia babensis TaxID=499548 RepID=A0A9X1NBB4_9ACTN|nr:GNAT family N-acetyltransferase [Kineosporia babensis]MCD5310973.1 GNAT family N-acetyltransferase [Kineosporia babensis]